MQLISFGPKQVLISSDWGIGPAKVQNPGGHFHSLYMHIIRYVPRERPPFSALKSYHFHKWQKYSAPEHHNFTFLPFRRPSFSKFLNVQAFLSSPPRPAYCMGLAAGQSASQTRPTVSSETPPLSRSSSLRSPHFSLCLGTYIPKFVASAPPPPVQNWFGGYNLAI